MARAHEMRGRRARLANLQLQSRMLERRAAFAVPEECLDYSAPAQGAAETAVVEDTRGREELSEYDSVEERIIRDAEGGVRLLPFQRD